jgi:Reverse transcriptase (RNA-dependent DNA polymerase)
MVSHFDSFKASIPFSENSNESIDYAAMQSILDKHNVTFDGVSIDGFFNSDSPLAFTAGTKNNPDMLSQTQMLTASDREQFIEPQHPEIQGLCDADVFEFHPIADLPSGSRLLNAIWSYRHKRHPTDRVLLKHKSRLCVDGSQQQHGVDYWETYAPVVHWSTVCMVLILSALLRLKSRQIDYTQAFPQVTLDDDVYMRIPQGWSYDPSSQMLVQDESDPRSQDKEHFVRLKRNLYMASNRLPEIGSFTSRKVC